MRWHLFATARRITVSGASDRTKMTAQRLVSANRSQWPYAASTFYYVYAKSENKMATSTLALFEYKQLLDKHGVLLQFPKTVDEE